MVTARPVFVQRCLVLFGSIPFILRPIVFWMLQVKGFHKIVAVSFGQNAGRGNRGVGGIAFNHALVRHFFIGLKTVTVNQQKLRLQA